MSERQLGKILWWNGKTMPPADAKIGLLTHSLHYGLGAFEGIRAYKSPQGKLVIFRLREHVQRLLDSCKIAQIQVPYTLAQLENAIVETVRGSGLAEGCYVRPLVFIGDGPLGVYPGTNPPIEVAIMTWVWGAYLGKEAKEKGARIKISSFCRGHVNATMSKGKISGQYTTGILAKLEVKRMGYDEALLLDTDGFVAEGSGENIFMRRGNVLKTTPLTSILDGITRATIIELASKNGWQVREERFTRDELYCADEAFFTGTAAEITPIVEVDDRKLGSGTPGEWTQKISKEYEALVRGVSDPKSTYLTYV
jgi:branched-chain amino acid aminotransferase